MVEVNGVTLIDRMLHQIEAHKLSRIIIVVGYEGEKLIDYIETLDIKKYDRVFGSVLTVIQEFLYHINKAAAVIGSRQIVSVLLLMCDDRILDTMT